MSLSNKLAVFFRVPSEFCPALPSTPLPLPRASNLPEKLIICHIASVLRRTLMRSSGSREETPCQAFERGFGSSVGHQTWPVNSTQSHLDVLQPFFLCCIQWGHLRAVSFSLGQQSMGQCGYSFPLYPKQSNTDALCAIRDSVPSYCRPNNTE